MNIVVLSGRLTRDPELKTVGETQLVRFTLAVARMKKDEADFISCVAFGKTAEYLSKYGAKGMKTEVSGRIQTGSFQKGEEKVYTTDVIAERIELFFNQETKKKEEEGFIQATFMDEIPFA